MQHWHVPSPSGLGCVFLLSGILLYLTATCSDPKKIKTIYLRQYLTTSGEKPKSMHLPSMMCPVDWPFSLLTVAFCCRVPQLRNLRN